MASMMEQLLAKIAENSQKNIDQNAKILDINKQSSDAIKNLTRNLGTAIGSKNSLSNLDVGKQAIAKRVAFGGGNSDVNPRNVFSNRNLMPDRGPADRDPNTRFSDLGQKQKINYLQNLISERKEFLKTIGSNAKGDAYIAEHKENITKIKSGKNLPDLINKRQVDTDKLKPLSVAGQFATAFGGKLATPLAVVGAALTGFEIAGSIVAGGKSQVTDNLSSYTSIQQSAGSNSWMNALLSFTQVGKIAKGYESYQSWAATTFSSVGFGPK